MAKVIMLLVFMIASGLLAFAWFQAGKYSEKSSYLKKLKVLLDEVGLDLNAVLTEEEAQQKKAQLDMLERLYSLY